MRPLLLGLSVNFQLWEGDDVGSRNMHVKIYRLLIPFCTGRFSNLDQYRAMPAEKAAILLLSGICQLAGRVESLSRTHQSQPSLRYER